MQLLVPRDHNAVNIGMHKEQMGRLILVTIEKIGNDSNKSKFDSEGN
jgi:hypothetical protein